MSKMKEEIFADRIGKIHFAGGMVRFDYETLQPTENGKTPDSESVVRIIMPPQGFLSAYESMRQLTEKLLDAGILKQNAKSGTKK